MLILFPIVCLCSASLAGGCDSLRLDANLTVVGVYHLKVLAAGIALTHDDLKVLHVSHVLVFVHAESLARGSDNSQTKWTDIHVGYVT